LKEKAAEGWEKTKDVAETVKEKTVEGKSSKFDPDPTSKFRLKMKIST
jgi:hypothetical protein